MTKGLGLLAVAGLLLAGCSHSDPRPDAYDACKQAVEHHFDDPGIKGFASYDDAQVRNTDGVYDVQGYIAGTNGLGQSAHIDFTCQLRHDGDNWNLVNLDLA